MFKTNSIISIFSKSRNLVINKCFKTKIIRNKIVNAMQETIRNEEEKLDPIRTDEISKFLRSKRLTLKVSDNSRFIELSKKSDDYITRMIINLE